MLREPGKSTQNDPELLFSQRKPNKDRWIQDVLKIVSGTLIAQALNAFATPILSRLYTPEEYGVFGIFTSLSLTFSTIICLRYDVAIVLPHKDEDAVDLLRISLASSLFISVLIGSFIFLASKMATFDVSPTNLSYGLLLATNLFGMGLYQVFTYWSTRHQRFWWLSWARILATTSTVIIQIGLALIMSQRGNGLIFGFLAGFFISGFIQLIPIWLEDRSVILRNFSTQKLVTNLKRYRKFPLVDSWNAILNATSWNLVPLLIFTLFSSAQAGYYAMAYRLLQMPVALISVAIGQVFYQRASQLKSSSEEMKKIASSVLRRLIALGLFPAVLLTLIGKDIFILFLGKAWAEAGTYVQIMGLWLFFWFLSSPFNVLTSVMERQGIAVVFEMISLVCRVSSIIIGSYFGNIYLAIGLFAGSGILVFSGYTLTCFRLIKMPFNEVIRPMIEFLPVSLLMSLIFLLVRTMFHPSPLQMTVIGGIFAASYTIIFLHKGILKSA